MFYPTVHQGPIQVSPTLPEFRFPRKESVKFDVSFFTSEQDSLLSQLPQVKTDIPCMVLPNICIILTSQKREILPFTKPTSLKHGDGFLICSSIAHLTVACRIFPSYSLELWVPLGVPRDRS